MAYNFASLKQKAQETREWLSKEYLGIRTGRATPALLDSVEVNAYGAKAPINQVASVLGEDARTLRVNPYDASQAKEIEKAITAANLGVSVSADATGVRVSFPELTGERRQVLLKLVKSKLEEAKVALRGVRDHVWDDIQKKEKAKEITEDEKFRYKEEMEKLISEAGKDLEALSEKKEVEIES